MAHVRGKLEMKNGRVMDNLGQQLLLEGVGLTSGNHPFGNMATANTHRMLRAWNCHDDLLSACIDALDLLSERHQNPDTGVWGDTEVEQIATQLEASISRAEKHP